MSRLYCPVLGADWSYGCLNRSRCRLGGWAACLSLGVLMAGLVSCGGHAKIKPLSLNLYQQWKLQPGMMVGNANVTSGLGDLVLVLEDQVVYMPRSGRVDPLVSGPFQTPLACVAISSPELPAYKLRLCNLHHVQLGEQPQGAVIGRGRQVAIALLRKQPEGTWAFVEPAPSLLNALFQSPG